MRKPEFFLVGAPKSGTTSLVSYLRQHPAVFIPVKETQFFSDFPVTARYRVNGLEAFGAIYERCPDGAVAGDASTWHLPSVHAARRIHAFNPAARIAMILRNPVDRAYSHYWHKRRVRADQDQEARCETLSFEQALEAEERRIEAGWGVGFRYVATGQYADQVRRYLETFPRNRVKMYVFEDFVRDADALCRDLFRFLELDPGQRVRSDEVFNRGLTYRSRLFATLLGGSFPGRARVKRALPARMLRMARPLKRFNAVRPPAMAPATRAWLVERFRPDVERLESILDRDLSRWRADASALLAARLELRRPSRPPVKGRA